MRANKESLLTIVEVFIHDPLYKWALSPLKALQRQRVSNELVAYVMFLLRGHSCQNGDQVNCVVDEGLPPSLHVACLLGSGQNVENNRVFLVPERKMSFVCLALSGKMLKSDV